MDYMNPFGLMTQPSDFNVSNPADAGIMQAGASGYRNAMGMPFYQMGMQNQAADTIQNIIKAREFMGQTATNQREMGRQAQIARDTATVEEQPSQTALNIATNQAGLERLPHETKVKIAQLKNQLISEEGAPMREFAQQASDYTNQLKNIKDPTQKAQLWNQFVMDYQTRHPGAPIPQQFAQWSPQNEQFLSLVHEANVMDTKTAQELLKIKEQGKNAERVAQIGANATFGAAQLHERGLNSRAEVAGGSREEQAAARRYAAELKAQEPRLNAIALKIMTAPDQETKDALVQEYQSIIDEARGRVTGGEGSSAPKPAANVPAELAGPLNAAGWKYEPQIYDYRVVKGKVERRKK